MDMLLPPLDLSRMPPAIKDWLLAKAASKGISPQEAAIQVLDARAERVGFPVLGTSSNEKVDTPACPAK